MESEKAPSTTTSGYVSKCTLSGPAEHSVSDELQTTHLAVI